MLHGCEAGSVVTFSSHLHTAGVGKPHLGARLGSLFRASKASQVNIFFKGNVHDQDKSSLVKLGYFFLVFTK